MSDQKVISLIEEITAILKAIAEGETKEAAELLNEFEELWIDSYKEEELGLSDLVENINGVIGYIDCVIENN